MCHKYVTEEWLKTDHWLNIIRIKRRKCLQRGVRDYGWHRKEEEEEKGNVLWEPIILDMSLPAPITLKLSQGKKRFPYYVSFFWKSKWNTQGEYSNDWRSPLSVQNKKCFTTNCNDAMTFLGSIIALSQLMADRCNMHVLIYSAAERGCLVTSCALRHSSRRCADVRKRFTRKTITSPKMKERKPQVEWQGRLGSFWHLFLWEESQDATNSLPQIAQSPLAAASV